MEPMSPTTTLSTPAMAMPMDAADAAFFAGEPEEILHDYFTDGWDSDDAMLGWVDETMVRPRRRLH